MPRQPQQVEQMARKRRRRRSKLTNSLEARITRERPPRGRTFKSSSTTLTFQWSRSYRKSISQQPWKSSQMGQAHRFPRSRAAWKVCNRNLLTTLLRSRKSRRWSRPCFHHHWSSQNHSRLQLLKRRGKVSSSKSIRKRPLTKSRFFRPHETSTLKKSRGTTSASQTKHFLSHQAWAV